MELKDVLIDLEIDVSKATPNQAAVSSERQ
jgi:hypothetical protein